MDNIKHKSDFEFNQQGMFVKILLEDKNEARVLLKLRNVTHINYIYPNGWEAPEIEFHSDIQCDMMHLETGQTIKFLSNNVALKDGEWRLVRFDSEPERVEYDQFQTLEQG